MAFADADAEQLRQSVYHIDGIGVAALFAHPGDRVQGVIEEMRVDLRLQRFQLSFAKVYLFFPDGVHQLLDPHDHVPKGTGKLLHFPGPSHRMVGKVVSAGFKVLHGRSQPAQGAVQQLGKEPTGE